MRNLAPLIVTGVLAAGPAAAQAPPPAPAPSKPLSTSLGVVVFPAKGQAADKQAADEGECFAWSKGQTGVDPMALSAPPPAAAAQPAAPAAEPPRGTRLRGAARGAAAGAVIGEIADDDAGKGAAIGATAGVMKGGADARKQQAQAQQAAAAQAQQQAAQQQAAKADQLALFNKGFAACLEGRGYTVK
jgi:uncharacterized protein YcfJ